MELRDSVNGASGELSGSAETPKRISIDRLEFGCQWEQQAEEQQVEEALNLYAKAARARMQPAAPEQPEGADSERLEALSQELKLRQKCQDIAALIMADEQGLMDSEDDEEE